MRKKIYLYSSGKMEEMEKKKIKGAKIANKLHY